MPIRAASFHGHVDSIQAGSGAAFSLLPPENATGNFVKVVQRVPVKIIFDTAAGRLYRPGHVGGADREGAMSETTARRSRTSAARRPDNRNPWLVAVVISIATFMQVLDTSIANVALQYIAGSLAASIDESTWILTSYLVASAVVLPISGWLSGVIGRKRFYMMCVATFTVSSILCALAPNLEMLIFFRVLQGLGGGGMAPSEQSMLADTFPPRQRSQAFALYGVAVIVAPTVGPTLGGWLTDNLSWHWIFLINGPIGVMSLDPGAIHGDRTAKC